MNIIIIIIISYVGANAMLLPFVVVWGLSKQVQFTQVKVTAAFTVFNPT